MKIIRRRFLQLLGLAGAALACSPLPSFAKTIVTRSPLAGVSGSIGDIIKAVWPHINEVIGWTDDKLIRMEAEKKIHRLTFGVFAEAHFQHKDGTVETRKYDIEQLFVPIIWTAAQEQAQLTQSARISTVKSSIQDAIERHDALLAQYIPEGGTLYLSKTYTRCIGEVHQTPNNASNYIPVYTAFVIVDKDGYQVKIGPRFLQTDADFMVEHDYSSLEDDFEIPY